MSEIPSYLSLLLGDLGGCLGEISAVGLIIGFAYMLWKKITTWHVPVAMLGTMFIFTGVLWLINPDKYIDPVFHILTGGALLGAFYMATDYVTLPHDGERYADLWGWHRFHYSCDPRVWIIP
jgi:electron transport complex protein RnfD